MIIMRAIAVWNKFWFEPASPAPLALFRVFVGILAFIDGLLWYPDLTTWFSNNGVFPLETLRFTHAGLSALIMFPFDDQALYIFWALYMVACVFGIVGFCTRSSMFFIWFFCCSLSRREFAFWHQAHLFIRLYSFMLIIGPSGAMYSVDAWIKKRHGNYLAQKKYPLLVQRLLQVQIALVYFRASIGKLLGSEWQQGTAVYYVMHDTNIVRHTVPGFLDNIWIYKLLTYYTMCIEMCLWTFIWVPGVSKLVLLGGLFLHGGIEWFINLDLLEWAVVVSYLLFLPAKDIEYSVTKMRNLVLRRKA